MDLRKLCHIPAVGPLGGVCAGIGYGLCIPPWIIRLLFLLCVFVYGFGLLPYIILWIALPRVDNIPSDYGERTGER